MYSGNHSIASPLGTLIEAALELRNDSRLCFMFIGGGLGKKEVDDAIRNHRPPNMVSLPYQPLSEIKYSLSAASVHVVALGDPMVGVIHPCKIYGAMAVSRPILMFGPSPSHLADLIERYHIGWRVAHGDVAGALARLREIAQSPAETLDAMGTAAREVVERELSQERLCAQFCDVIERGLVRPA
jgi:glycosyltransferase involved in cell wall biosynthesis